MSTKLFSDKLYYAGQIGKNINSDVKEYIFMKQAGAGVVPSSGLARS